MTVEKNEDDKKNKIDVDKLVKMLYADHLNFKENPTDTEIKSFVNQVNDLAEKLSEGISVVLMVAAAERGVSDGKIRQGGIMKGSKVLNLWSCEFTKKRILREADQGE